MVYQLSRVAKTKERQADIQWSILVWLSALIDEEPGVTYGFIVGICTDAGTDSFYFKQIICFKDVSNIFRNDFFAQFFDDKQVDSK